MAMAAPSFPPGFGGISHVRLHEAPLKVKRPRGSKVTWASADQLCQIRMFLAEDAPSVAGSNQEYLQFKSTRFMHEAHDLPPGFGAVNPQNVVASVPWTCPQKFEVDPTWAVEAGGESKEVEEQKLRESKVLEAIYPRHSVIPENPADPLEPCPTVVDDADIRVIPVTPADDDDTDEPIVGGSGSMNHGGASTMVNPQMNHGATTDAGLNAALTQVSKEQGVNAGLLFQLLSNPSFVETFSGVRNKSMVNASNNGLLLNMPSPCTSSSSSSISSLMMQNLTTISHSGITTTTPSNSATITTTMTTSPPPPPPPLSALSSGGSTGFGGPPGFGPPPSSSSGFGAGLTPGLSNDLPPGFGGSFGGSQQVLQQLLPQQQQQSQQQQFMAPPNSTSSSSLRPPVRSHNEQYFKDLILQHGGKQGCEAGNSNKNYHHNNNNHNHNHNNKMRATKACAYFNTPKGCRNGSKCMFSHDGPDLKRPFDSSHQPRQQHHSKRMRS